MLVSKKIFFTSSIFLIITLILWGAYYLSFKKPAEKSAEIEKKLQEKPANPQLEAAKKAEKVKIYAISEDPVLSPVYVSEDNLIKYYSKADGRAYQIEPSGQNRKIISNKELPGFLGAIWSPDQKTAILKKSQGGGKIRFYLYNYSAKSETPLKDNISYVAWQNNNKIIYRYFNPVDQRASLNAANPDGTDWKKIFDLDNSNYFIAPIPQSGIISFWNPPDAFTETRFQSTLPFDSQSRILFAGGFGGDYLWNADGTLALMSQSNKKGGGRINLGIVNNRSGEYRSLEIPTLVSKTAWSKDNATVYYALPGSLPEDAVMPNDYSSGKFNTADTFWKVDVNTGKKSRIVDLDQITVSLDAASLFLSYDESLLFFTNRTDGKLYRISL